MTSAAPARRRQLPALTGLRAIAAAAVFIVHAGFDLTSTSLGGLLRTLSPWSTAGVILFFTLSGYLLADAASWRFGKATFARHRVARIVPLYLAGLIAAVLLQYVQAHRHGLHDTLLDPGNLTLNVLLLQAWSSRGISASIDIPAWSLSVEVLFYAALPFTIGGFERVCRRAPRIVLAVILAAGAAGGVALTVGWCTDSLPLAYLPVFFLGGYFSVVRPAVPRPAWCGVGVAAALALYTAINHAGHGVSGPGVLWMAAPCAVLVHSLATHGGRPLEHPWLVRAGIWSYAFFLIHTLVIFVTSAVVSTPPSSTAKGVALFVFDFIASWAIAAAAYKLIEHPAQERLTRQATFVPG